MSEGIKRCAETVGSAFLVIRATAAAPWCRWVATAASRSWASCRTARPSVARPATRRVTPASPVSWCGSRCSPASTRGRPASTTTDVAFALSHCHRSVQSSTAMLVSMCVCVCVCVCTELHIDDYTLGRFRFKIFAHIDSPPKGPPPLAFGFAGEGGRPR